MPNNQLRIIKQIATAYNRFDYSLFEPLLADNSVYESQMVHVPMNGKENFLAFIKAKFKTIQETNAIVFAEIGYLSLKSQTGNPKFLMKENTPCIIIAQGNKENKASILLIKVKDDLVTQMDMCTKVQPHWSAAKRTNEYPA